MCLSLLVVVFHGASYAVKALSSRKPHIGLTDLRPELALYLLETLESIAVRNAAFGISHFTGNTAQSEKKIDEKILITCGHTVLLHNTPGFLKIW